MICDYCDGFGYHNADYFEELDDNPITLRLVQITCVYCDGTGELLEPQEDELYGQRELISELEKRVKRLEDLHEWIKEPG